MKNLFSIFCLFVISSSAFTQDMKEYDQSITIDGCEIHGSVIESGLADGLFVLFISGSGPTDRNGNNPMMTNNSLKMMALELGKQGISSLRYDKRLIGESCPGSMNESELRFDRYVDDAIAWLVWMNKTFEQKRIVVIGHSEGSLVGMLAAQTNEVEGFISLAGTGRSADIVILEQISKQAPTLVESTKKTLEILKTGAVDNEVDPMLYQIFRPSVQPYMISWMKYDPAVEIAKLNMPIQIIQGTQDLQVTIEDASMLRNAAQSADYQLIEGMNHVLKNVGEDQTLNMNSYADPKMPLHPLLTPKIMAFLNAIGK